jgi:hypothetical protein
MPLRRLHGLSAAVSGRLRRALSTAASHPPWAFIDYVGSCPSSAQRASFQLAEPPGVSNLVGLGPEAPVDPDSDVLRMRLGNAGATSGDGLLLLDFMDLRATDPVVATHAAPPQQKSTGSTVHLFSASGATQESRVVGYNLDPDVTRYVCNPITGQMFRLPDIDGAKNTQTNCEFGLLIQSARGDGPPDRYGVASIEPDRPGGNASFLMRRFLSQTGEWEKLVRLPSPLPLPRPLVIHINNEVLAFAGRLWWVDLSWGVVSADPFSDRPELRFVELPRGRVLPLPRSEAEVSSSLMAQGMYRRMGVSEGRMRYVERPRCPLSCSTPSSLATTVAAGRWSGRR